MIEIFQQCFLPRPLHCGYVFTLSADCNRPMNNKFVVVFWFFWGEGVDRRQLPLTGAVAATLAGALTGTIVGVIGLQYNWAVSI